MKMNSDVRSRLRLSEFIESASRVGPISLIHEYLSMDARERSGPVCDWPPIFIRLSARIKEGHGLGQASGLFFQCICRDDSLLNQLGVLMRH